MELAPITIRKSDGIVLWTASEDGPDTNKIVREDGTLRYVGTMYVKFMAMLTNHGPDSADPQFNWENTQKIRVNHPTDDHPTGHCTEVECGVFVTPDLFASRQYHLVHTPCSPFPFPQ